MRTISSGVFAYQQKFIINQIYLKLIRKKRKELSFCRNSDILIPISLHLNVGDLNISNLNHFRSNNDILKYQRFTPSG